MKQLKVIKGIDGSKSAEIMLQKGDILDFGEGKFKVGTIVLNKETGCFEIYVSLEKSVGNSLESLSLQSKKRSRKTVHPRDVIL